MAVGNNKVEGGNSLLLKGNTIQYLFILYTALLISANFVGDHSFQLFYFSYSAGTLVIQLVFCGLLGFTETIGSRKTSQLIGISACINLAVALFSYFILGFPIPEFWLKHDIESIETWQQINVIVLLTVGYTCSSFSMVKVAQCLKTTFGQDWLLIRVMLILFAGLIVDMMVLLPILFFLAPDRYMALWKMLSLASVKVTFSLVAIPVSYFFIHLLKKRTFVL